MANRYTDKTEITREEQLKLLGLQVLYQQAFRQIEELERAAAAITGEAEWQGCLASDWMMDGKGIDDLMGRFSFTLVDAPRPDTD